MLVVHTPVPHIITQLSADPILKLFDPFAAGDTEAVKKTQCITPLPFKYVVPLFLATSNVTPPTAITSKR